MDSFLPHFRYFYSHTGATMPQKKNAKDPKGGSDLGGRITALRKAKGWSQTELASKTGVSYAQIGRYETKGAQPPAEVLKALATALDTTVYYLLSGSADDRAKDSLTDAEVIRYFTPCHKTTRPR